MSLLSVMSIILAACLNAFGSFLIKYASIYKASPNYHFSFHAIITKTTPH
jgi:hypothetical protein